MEIQIRKAERGDAAAIIGLMGDFAEFEGFSSYFQVTEERLAAAMFGEAAFVEGLLAFEGASPVAYALFYPSFASFRGQRGLFLEDLFISEAARRKGIGEALLKEVARLAWKRGFERIDFQVLDWNTPAIRFYEGLGASRDDEERHFRFTDEAFAALAE